MEENVEQKDLESDKKEGFQNYIKEISQEEDTDRITNKFEKINIKNNLDTTENNLSKPKPKIRGRGNFMWISKTEIEDEESLEIMEKLNLQRKLEDEELENLSNNIENEHSKQKDKKFKCTNKIEYLEKENKLQKRNSQLIKFCNENIILNQKKYDNSNSEYDKYFDYFFKDPKRENSNKKVNEYAESMLPKIDHIFCVYDILLNNKQDYNSTLELESVIEGIILNKINIENKLSCLKILQEKLSDLMFEYTKLIIKNTEGDLKDKKFGFFSMKNIIELQTNKIYIIIADNFSIAKYLMKELNNKINDKIKQFKIDFLANSPDSIKTCVSIRIGKKIPKPNVAVISRMINSHLKSNFSKYK